MEAPYAQKRNAYGSRADVRRSDRVARPIGSEARLGLTAREQDLAAFPLDATLSGSRTVKVLDA
jgi:hypothetical protein